MLSLCPLPWFALAASVCPYYRIVASVPHCLVVPPLRPRCTLSVSHCASVDVLNRMTKELTHLVEQTNQAGVVEVELVVDPRQNVDGVLCDPGVQHHMECAAEAHAPGAWVSMPSGAAHDAQMLARVMPVGMLFIPSIRGISHNFEENTDDNDIVVGCRVFLEAIKNVSTAARQCARCKL